MVGYIAATVFNWMVDVDDRAVIIFVEFLGCNAYNLRIVNRNHRLQSCFKT